MRAVTNAPAEPLPLPRAIAAILAVFAGLAALFQFYGNLTNIARVGHSLFHWMANRWVHFPDLNYCIFLPFVSLWALWRQRAKLAAAPRAADLRGLAFFAAALFLHWAGYRAQQPRVSMAALIALLWLVPFTLCGWRFARELLFPAGYLFLTIPLNFLDSLTSPLRILSAWVAATVLNGFGLHVHQVGSGIYSTAANAFALEVAPECSGLHSLFAMTALMGAYAWYSQPTQAKKWILFACSVPVALVANIFRILLVVLVAALFGQDRAMGLWHDWSGYPVFVVGILLMLLVDKLLNLRGKGAADAG